MRTSRWRRRSEVIVKIEALNAMTLNEGALALPEFSSQRHAGGTLSLTPLLLVILPQMTDGSILLGHQLLDGSTPRGERKSRIDCSDLTLHMGDDLLCRRAQQR